jgi:dihydroorotate dehydrogenase (fumarate)/dihydropyrimidine dehydrogenase (NAD+) subunit PreA
MVDVSLKFCGVPPKYLVIVASLETTNSPEVIRECVDAGAAGVIIKTATDIEDMARLTETRRTRSSMRATN